MSGRGSVHSVVPTSPLNLRESPILVLDEIKWAPIKVSLSDVLKGNDEPIQVNKDGELVCGVINLLRLKALNPQLEFVEVTIVGDSQLPPISEVSSAA